MLNVCFLMCVGCIYVHTCYNNMPYFSLTACFRPYSYNPIFSDGPYYGTLIKSVDTHNDVCFHLLTLKMCLCTFLFQLT